MIEPQRRDAEDEQVPEAGQPAIQVDPHPPGFPPRTTRGNPVREDGDRLRCGCVQESTAVGAPGCAKGGCIGQSTHSGCSQKAAQMRWRMFICTSSHAAVVAVGDDHELISEIGHLPALLSDEGDGLDAGGLGPVEGADEVRRVAAHADAEQHVSGPRIFINWRTKMSS